MQDCPPFPGMHEYIPLVAGATLTAVDALQDDACDVAVCWDGGRSATSPPTHSQVCSHEYQFRHHAQKSHASGFCYVADCVLAILALRRIPAPVPAQRSRVMYLDLDLHFSDAVSHAFHHPGARALSQVLVRNSSVCAWPEFEPPPHATRRSRCTTLRPASSPSLPCPRCQIQRTPRLTRLHYRFRSREVPLAARLPGCGPSSSVSRMCFNPTLS